MIAERSLYSFVISNRRYLASFQFDDDKMIGSIDKVNASLPVRMHPVAVLRWYEIENQDLVVDDSGEENVTLSPLDWLMGGL